MSAPGSDRSATPDHDGTAHSGAAATGATGARGERGPNASIAGAITDVSERALLLVHEEIELAKAEVSEKVSRLLRGTVVGVAAGIFIVGAIQFFFVGLALLAWWALPVAYSEFFWGFFLVAAGLLLLAILAGVIAARAVRSGSPPVPSMAIEEARKIRESVSGSGAGGPLPVTESLPGWNPVPTTEEPSAHDAVPAFGATVPSEPGASRDAQTDAG